MAISQTEYAAIRHKIWVPGSVGKQELKKLAVLPSSTQLRATFDVVNDAFAANPPDLTKRIDRALVLAWASANRPILQPALQAALGQTGSTALAIEIIKAVADWKVS